MRFGRSVGFEQQTIEWDLSGIFATALGGEHALVDGEIAACIARADEFVRGTAKPVEGDNGGVGPWGEQSVRLEDVQYGSCRMNGVN